MEFVSISEEILGKNDYLFYLKTILSGKEIIDDFFDSVMVMDKDENIKNNRLSLLTSLNIIFNRVANLSLIESK